MVYNEDEIGRITRKEVYNDSNDLTYAATYTYDESDDSDYTVYKGLLYRVVDKEGAVQNGYDARGRILKSTRSLTINSAHYTTQTAYDDAGRTNLCESLEGRGRGNIQRRPGSEHRRVPCAGRVFALHGRRHKDSGMGPVFLHLHGALPLLPWPAQYPAFRD